MEAGHAHDSLKKHEVIGGGIRKNARCPECNSVDRERLVLLYLVYETKLFQNRHYVLHVAPELYIRKFLSLRKSCLLYTSPSPRDLSTSRMPSSA